MSQLIHARKRSGAWRFRLWRTNTNSYETDNLTEKQLRDARLFSSIFTTLIEEKTVLPMLIKEAKMRGVDGRGAKSCDVKGPWETERLSARKREYQEKLFREKVGGVK